MESILKDWTFLIIDDDTNVLDITKTFLISFGCKEVIAHSRSDQFLKSCKEHLDKDKVMLVVDLEIDGSEVDRGEKVLKKAIELSNKHPLSLLVSGNHKDPVFVNPWESGFVGSLPKPFRLKEFKNTIFSIVQSTEEV